MAELLTDDIITDALVDDGIMEEPDAPWLLEYIDTEYGGKLDNTSDWCDKRHDLKIYSESTADGYDINTISQIVKNSVVPIIGLGVVSFV